MKAPVCFQCGFVISGQFICCPEHPNAQKVVLNIDRDRDLLVDPAQKDLGVIYISPVTGMYHAIPHGVVLAKLNQCFNSKLEIKNRPECI